MKKVEVSKKRNIVFVGHHGSGKTSLIEAILYNTGIVDRLGRVDDGNTFSDYLDEEKDKKITIASKLLHTSYKGHEINIMDTPGYSDFIGDIKGAIHAADGAVLVINAQSGVEVETEKIWEWLNDYNIPRMVVINKMDKERASFASALESLENELEAKVCPVRLPLGQEDNFKGIVDLITDKVLTFDDKGNISKQDDITDEIREEIADFHQKMIEAAVETDDEMMERYFADEKIEDDEIRQGLRDGALDGTLVPVVCTNALNCIGIASLLDAVINYLPDPLNRKTFTCIDLKDEEKKEKVVEIKEDGPGIGFVYKSSIDPFAGKMSLIRIFSGSLSGDSEWIDLSTGNKSRVGHILSVTGKKHNTVHDAGVGDIIAVAKVDDFDTNHTLSSTAGNTVVKPTEYPQPSIYMSLHTEDKNEEDKLGTLVPKYIAGDPTINFVRNPETKQHVITAAGQMQVELLAQKLRNQNKIGVELVTPKVAYRETVTAKGEGRYRHKKQSGGRGQFAEVQMRLAPIERGKQYEFINSIFGGAVPSKFIPAVEKGIAEAMEKGIVASYPVVDVSVELFDGQYHEVDSSEMAFKIASSMGFRQIARDSCKPILLEPIMDVSVFIPESYMGDVMGDLNSRRGRVQGMDPVGRKQVIRAKVPLSEMYSYAADLRSITQGRGVFEMDFSHYDPVPHEIAEKIIAESKVEDEEE